jgi:hypothetical protein
MDYYNSVLAKRPGIEKTVFFPNLGKFYHLQKAATKQNAKGDVMSELKKHILRDGVFPLYEDGVSATRAFKEWQSGRGLEAAYSVCIGSVVGFCVT